MRVLLRQRGRTLYFQLPDHWTGYAEDAYAFRSTKDALRFAAARGFENVEPVIIEADHGGSTHTSH